MLLLKKFKVNLDQRHCFFLLCNDFVFLQLQKPNFKVIFYKVFKAGSGSALRKQLDPDPQKMKADPQHWIYCKLAEVLFFFP